MLTVLDEQGVAEPQGRLQVLAEGVVEEGGLGDLPVFVLVQDELRSLKKKKYNKTLKTTSRFRFD